MRVANKSMAAAIGVAAVIALAVWQVPVLLAALEGRVGDQEINATGKLLYAENCASCHGVNLEGQEDWKTRDAEGYLPAPPHDETGHTWHHNEALLFRITKFGIAKLAGSDDYKTRMPAYEDILTDEQITSVLSYIKSQWPEKIRVRYDEVNSQP